MNVLSVDWDYFLPNCEIYDWGHNEEQGLFYEFIWHTRCFSRSLTGKHERAIDVYWPNPKLLNGFWDKVLKSKFYVSYVVESHSDAYKLLEVFKKDLHIWNYDAHHDCGYHPKKNVDCGNWAEKLGRRVAAFHQIYPPWRKKSPEGKSVRTPTSVGYNRVPVDADVVIVCRSSCWTPPWCDSMWLDFVKPITKDNTITVPFVAKARSLDIEQARKIAVVEENAFTTLRKKHEEAMQCVS